MGWLAEAIGILVLILVVAPLISLYVRRRVLSNRGGVFDCGLRREMSKRNWMLGLARYEGDALEWYRVFSVSLRPRLMLHRSRVELLGRRAPNEVEQVTLFESSEIVRVHMRDDGRTVELAMSSDSVTGLMSWIEAGPLAGQLYPGGE